MIHPDNTTVKMYKSRKGAKAPLGIYAKSCNPPPLPSPTDNALFRRIERFSLQSAARLNLPDERVCTCLRNPVGQNVQIKHNTAKDSYGYRGLETCGSVWMCPVCAAKISEKRKVELSEGISRWIDQGGSVIMATFTVQHFKTDSFNKTITGLQTAYRKLLNRKSGQAIVAEMGVIGRIKALETTYGENGWHPHFHVLMFLKNAHIDLEAYQIRLLECWRSVCLSSGLNKPNDHGLQLHDGTYAATYVSKWGLESEMTKGHMKTSRDGYSPFDLLRAQVGTYSGTAKPLAPGEYKNLFRDYAYNMKGKRQLVWSDGLRDLLGLRQEKSDQELVDEVEEQEVLFVNIPLAMWKVILKAEKRAEVLESCKLGLANFETYCCEIWLRYSDEVPF